MLPAKLLHIMEFRFEDILIKYFAEDTLIKLIYL